MEPDKPCAPKKSAKLRKAPGELKAMMDVQIWKEFPEELMEVVVARLPVATFLRFRLVSQKWNSLLRSPSFVQLLDEVAEQKQPWFFATSHGSGKASGEKMTGALYDPCMKKWHHDFPLPSTADLFPACAAGGLVCYPDYTCASFQVGNPLTQAWKKLPFSATARSSFHGEGFVAVGMVTQVQDYSARGYKIVWVDKRGKYEVYDSLKKSTCPGRVPANINLPSALITCSTVSIGTVVYFLCIKPDGIISYDVVSGVWQQFLIPAPPNGVRLTLAECGGRLWLVGLVGNNNNNNVGTFSVCVWELQMTMLVWTEAAMMPNLWCSGFKLERTMWCRCFGNKKLLVISLRSTWKTRVFTYDAVSREWTEVPRFVPPGDRRRRSIMSGIGFFPSLLASRDVNLCIWF